MTPMTSSTPPPTDSLPRWARVALGVLVAVSLGLTFLAYLNPHLAVDLANRLWACF